MVKAKKWVLAKLFDGLPTAANFSMQEEDLPALKDGEFLCEAIVLSVDPYMRLFGNVMPDGSTRPIGSTMVGEQIAKVTETKNAEYAVGAVVAIDCGWRTHTVTDGKQPSVRTLPHLGSLPPSLALGVLGMTGETAYFGLTEVLQPKKGETIFVNGAAGAVGSVVGQLAKIQGCTVIGCASSQEKVDYLKSIGFDAAFNYRTEDLATALKKAAPNGIDMFYDNVGGLSSLVVYQQMKLHGRVIVCGTMSGYNDKEGVGSAQKGPLPYDTILMKELRIQGYTLWSYIHRRNDATKEISQYIADGRMKYREVATHGFDKMPEAFIDMLKGSGIGKAVVHAH